MGLVGYGRIGSTTARRLSGFEVEIGCFDPAARADCPHLFFDTPTGLAAWCDLLIVTLAGGSATHGMLGAEVLRALGPEGWLVNVSRGSTVHEPALLQALEQRQIAGAGLDVFWREPRIDARFAALGNVVPQRRHAGGTGETRRDRSAGTRQPGRPFCRPAAVDPRGPKPGRTRA